MRISLIAAKEKLRHSAPEDQLEENINRASERLMLNGHFVGSRHVLRLSLFYGQIGLPTTYRTILGFKYDDRVRDLANQIYQFMPGHSDLLLGCGMEPLRDLGDSHATLYNLPLLGKLGIDYTGIVAQPVTLVGTDSDFMPIELTIPDKATFPDNPFTHIDRIFKSQGPVSVRVSHTADDLAVTLLTILAPKTEEAYHRRYILDELTATPAATALALCALRHIDFSDDQDILPFCNIAALDSMLQSLNFRKENDLVLAERYEADAVALENLELGVSRAANEIPALRLIHVGGTTPRLTSHY